MDILRDVRALVFYAPINVTEKIICTQQKEEVFIKVYCQVAHFGTSLFILSDCTHWYAIR